jgi:hypothetical protein
LFRRQRRAAQQQGQVQPDAQPGILPRQTDGLGLGGLIDHQAGGGQDALAVRPDDRLVDGRRSAEIIRVDDEPADGLRACHTGSGSRR